LNDIVINCDRSYWRKSSGNGVAAVPVANDGPKEDPIPDGATCVNQVKYFAIAVPP
jgi:hypothetical protein